MKPARELSLKNQDLPPEVVDLADSLISFQEGLDPQEQQALLLLVLAAMAGVRQGSTRLCVLGAEAEGALVARVRSLAGADGLEAVLRSIESILREGRAPKIIGVPGEYKPLILDGRHLYLQRMQREEDRFVEALADRIEKGSLAVSKSALDAAVADVLARPAFIGGQPVSLSSEQELAVARAVERRFSVTSGGPGTGKTSIVVTVLRVLARLAEKPESIALAAPTGKAAKRIADSVDRHLRSIASPSDEDRALLLHPPKPETLHRLLGYAPGADRFLHHESNPLSERTVIVDESSMIDLALMARLVRAVRKEARLVLLGDAAQLPSVDAGAVLRDISEVSFATTLRHSFRVDTRDPAGRTLQRVAQAVDRGEAGALFSSAEGEGIAVRDRVSDLSFSRLEMIEPGRGSLVRDALLRRWYLEQAVRPPNLEKTHRIEGGRFPKDDAREVETLLAHFERSKILCVTRSADFSTGAQAVNAKLHERALRDAQISGAPMTDKSDLVAGEPVMIERNDYERRLFNGDQGVIVEVSEGGATPHAMAVFRVDGELTAFHLDAIRESLSLAYAITVHKAQGSEFDAILLMLPDRDIPLVSREILYTALTRSRKAAVILGTRELLVSGVARRLYRDSGVSEKLARRLGAVYIG